MKKTILTTVAALSMLCTFAQWKPVGDKIKTPWAEKVDPANVLPEYPRPQMVRSQWVNLNGLWDYAIKPVGAMEPKTMDGKILVPFAVESSLSGVQKGLTEKDELWYRRTFSVPAAWKGSNVLLNFGAVDWKADVFVNDILAGSHTGGFTPFSLDITPYLKAKGEQKLVVRVFDGTDKGYQPRGKQVLNPNGIWYTPVSGIWQTVWIEPVAKSHISGIKAIPNLDQKNIAVTVAAENCTTGDLVEVKILDKGKLVASATGLPGNPLRPGIAEPKTWVPPPPAPGTLPPTTCHDEGFLQFFKKVLVRLRKPGEQIAGDFFQLVKKAHCKLLFSCDFPHFLNLHFLLLRRDVANRRRDAARCRFAALEGMVIPCKIESPFSFPLAEKKTAIHGQKKRR